MMNGFSFPASKTVVMQFYKVRAPFLQPRIYLHNDLIPEVNSVKFLGLVWDPKLNWVPHVAQLKNRFIIIIKKDWQCKAGRGRLTPYQSKD